MAGDQKSDTKQESQQEHVQLKPQESLEDPRMKAKAERADVAIEVTQLKSERFLEKPNAPEFTRLNLQESVEKQEALLSSLAGTAVFELIPFLLNEKGIKPEQLKDFFFKPPFSNPKEYFQTKSAQGAEDLFQSFLKIQEIFKSSPPLLPDGEKSVREYFDTHWETLVSKGRSAAGLMTHLASEMLPSGVQHENGEQGFFEKHSGKIIGGAVALGLVGSIYYFTRDSKKDEKANESPDYFGMLFKVLGVLGIVAGTICGLGRLSEVSTVRKWLKSLGVDDSVAMRAARLFSHGKLEEVYALLTTSQEVNRTHASISEKINSRISGANVTPSTIDKIRNIPYREIFPDNFLDALSKGAKDLAGAGFRQVPLVRHLVEEDPKFEKELQDIEKFIVLPENQEKIKKIAPGPRMTVLELLSRLCDVTSSSPAPSPLTVSAVIPAGKVGVDAARRSQEHQQSIQSHREKILEALRQEQSIDKKLNEQLQKDAENCLVLIEEIDTTSKGWWTREKQLASQFWRDVNEKTPEKGYAEQDFVAIYDQLQEVDSVILQDLRTQVSGIQSLKSTFADGKKISLTKVEKLKEEIENFYHNYSQLREKLDEINQIRIKEQEERAALMKSGSFKADFEKVKSGAELALNTLFGMQASVVFLREENGALVSMLGAATTITTGVGFLKGIAGTHGGVVAGLRGATKGAVAPVSKGFALSRWAFERLDFWHKSTTLRAVQEGRLTIPQGIQRIERYLNLYQYEWKDGSVQEWKTKKPGTFEKIRSVGRTELSHPQLEKIEKQMAELKELEAANYKTWAEAVKDGKKPNFELAQKLMKELEVKQLQAAMDDVVKSVANKLEPTAFEALSTSQKIETLSKAHKEADVYLEQAIKKAALMRRHGIPPSEIEDFMKVSQEELKVIRDSFGSSFAKAQALVKTPEEIAALEKLVAKELSAGKAIRAVIKPVGSQLGKSMKLKGWFALGFGAANIVYGFKKTSEKDLEDYTTEELEAIAREIGPDTLQIVVDVMAPFGATNWYAAIEGKEVISQKQLDGTARAKHVLFGTFGLVTDVLAVVAGGATFEVGGAGGVGVYLGAKSVKAALEGAGKSAKIIRVVEKILPRLADLAKNSGGFTKLISIMKSEKFLKALRGTQIVSGAAMVGTVAYDGYQIFYDTQDQPEHEVALSEDVASEIMQKQKEELPKEEDREELNIAFKKSRRKVPALTHVPQEQEGFEGLLE